MNNLTAEQFHLNYLTELASASVEDFVSAKTDEYCDSHPELVIVRFAGGIVNAFSAHVAREFENVGMAAVEALEFDETEEEYEGMNDTELDQARNQFEEDQNDLLGEIETYNIIEMHDLWVKLYDEYVNSMRIPEAA